MQPTKSLLWSESDRLAEVDACQILPVMREDAYDALARQAAEACDTPIALITILTEDRQWFKAAVGTSLTGTARAISFCTHAIEESDTLVVNDATQDVRFSDNPLVTNNPHIRFYAGVPLRTARGMPVGTICVLDQQPHDMTGEQQATLEKLAGDVVELLRARKEALAQDKLKIA